VRLPNADLAIIDRAKLESYLLSASHPIGRFKARFFAALGFSEAAWMNLEAALRRDHLTTDAELVETLALGQSYRIQAILNGPIASAPVVSVWFVRKGEEVPRLVTAYPGDKL